MARTPRKQQQQRYSVAIVGDGLTERIYFLDVRDTDRPPNLHIFPDYPSKIGSYKGVLDRAILLAEDYDRVYALIDMDKVIHDNQQEPYRNAKANAEAAGVIVLENTPCFEIWPLLHFVQTTRQFNNCKEVIAELKRNDRIPNYDKSEKFLLNLRLYQNYKERIKQFAIPNAKALENDRADKGPLYPRAEIFRFFEWYFQNAQ